MAISNHMALFTHFIDTDFFSFFRRSGSNVSKVFFSFCRHLFKNLKRYDCRSTPQLPDECFAAEFCSPAVDLYQGSLNDVITLNTFGVIFPFSNDCCQLTNVCFAQKIVSGVFTCRSYVFPSCFRWFEQLFIIYRAMVSL